MFGAIEGGMKVLDTVVINPPKRGAMKYVFSPMDYHPIYGLPTKVTHPGVNTKTWFGSPIPHIVHLNGRLDKHFCGTPEYREAWQMRKRKSYYDTDVKSQISQYQNRPFQAGRMVTLTGKVASTRDRLPFGYSDLDGPNHYYPSKRDSFYKSAKRIY
jgi:hypothetical protein